MIELKSNTKQTYFNKDPTNSIENYILDQEQNLNDMFIGHISLFKLNGIDYLKIDQDLELFDLWTNKIEINAQKGYQNASKDWPLSFVNFNANILIKLFDDIFDFSWQILFRWKVSLYILCLQILNLFSLLNICKNNDFLMC